MTRPPQARLPVDPKGHRGQRLEAARRADGILTRSDYREHSGPLGPGYAVTVLEHDVMDGHILKVDGCPEETQLRRRGRRRRPGGIAHRANAPRSVLGTPDRGPLR